MSTWYVKEAIGGPYGSGNGTSEANAWRGFQAVVWGPGGVVAGDTLYVVGTHKYITNGSNGFTFGTNRQTVGGTSGAHITIRGDYTGQPGIIMGAREILSASFADVGDGSFSVNVSNETSDIAMGTTIANMRLLSHAASQVACAGTEGSWFVDTVPTPDKLYVHPWGGTMTSVWHNWTTGWDMNGFSYTDFIGLTFMFGDSAKGNVILSHTDAQTPTGVTFTDCVIAWGQRTGVWANQQSDTVTFTRCLFHDLPTGTYPTVGQHTNWTFTDCEIYSGEESTIGFTFFGITAVDRHALGGQTISNMTVTGCWIHDWVGDGILIWLGSTPKTMNNLIAHHNLIENLTDPGNLGYHEGISMQGNNRADYSDCATGWQIYDNVIRNCVGDKTLIGGVGAAIRLKDGGYTVAANKPKVYHNTIDGCNYGLYWLVGTSSKCAFDYRNNIVYNPASGGYYTYIANFSSTNSITQNNNLLFPPTKSAWKASDTAATLAAWTTASGGLDANSVAADPQFADPAPTTENDYMLLGISPAATTGATGLGVSTDYLGTTFAATPSMGAFQAPVSGQGAETGTFTILRTHSIEVIRMAWVANALGTATYDELHLEGEIRRVVTKPGSPAPTDNYDVEILDADGVDVLAGKGLNRDTANVEQFVPLLGNGAADVNGLTSPDGIWPVSVNGLHTLTITNAGSGGAGTLVLYLQPHLVR